MAKEMKKRPTGGTVEKKTRLIMAGFTPRATAAAVHPNVCPYIVELGYIQRPSLGI